MSGTATKTVKYQIVGDASGATKAMQSTATSAESTAGKVKSSFGSAFASISNTGALGPLDEIVSKIGESFDALSGKGKSVGTVMAGVGTASAGVGAILTSLGDKDKIADQQMSQAFKNIGANADDFKGKIDESVKTMAKYGYSANQVKDGIGKLALATKDPAKAIGLMGTAADLAAQQHISLDSAVSQLVKVAAGKGTRTLSELGISTTTAGSSAKALASATKGVSSALATSNSALDAYQSKLTSIGQAHKATQAQVDAAMNAMEEYSNSLDVNGHATAGTAAAQAKYQDALKALGGSTGLTMSQQLSLGQSLDKVTGAQSKLEQAYQTQSDAQKKATTSTKKQGDALSQVAAATKGQAAAAADTFTGRIKAMRTEIENQVSTLGQKYGPALTAAGAGLGVLGGVMDGAHAIIGKLKGSTELMTGSQEALTVANGEGALAEDGLAASAGAADASMLPMLATIGLVIAAVALVALGAYELVTHWSAVFSTMKQVVTDAWHGIDSDFIQPVEKFFTEIPQFIQQHWQLILAILTGPIGLAVLFIKNHFQDILNFIQGIPSAITGFFSNIASDFERIGQNIVNGIVNGIKSMGSAIWHAVTSSIPGSGIVGSALSAIGLAEGGIVTKPTLAMIGEAGYPEAVIPLKGGASVKGFNDAVAPLTAVGGPGTMTSVSVGASGVSQQAASSGAGDVYLDGQKVGQLIAPHVRTNLIKQQKNYAGSTLR